MKKNFLWILLAVLIISCKEQNAKMETSVKDTAKSGNLGDSAKQAIVANLNDE